MTQVDKKDRTSFHGMIWLLAPAITQIWEMTQHQGMNRKDKSLKNSLKYFK